MFLITFGVNAQKPDFTNLELSNGWNQAEQLAFDSLGRMFVVEREGKVWMVDTSGAKASLPLIDISEEVGAWRDHGLNGFTLDPNFNNNGYFYLFYTVDRHHLLHYGTPTYNSAVNEYFDATIVRLTRYQADTATLCTTIIPGSRTILIGEDIKSGVPLLYESHSGGDLIFGTDGSLFITTGDGASYTYVDSGGGSSYWNQALMDSIIRPEENVGSFRSQMVNSLNGKILRVDPATGDGLDSNPFYDSNLPRSARSRVWTFGLRHPFRGTLRPGTGEKDITAGNPGVLYIGDVGWDNWEDINIVTGPGQNFGWPLYEGLTPHIGYQNTDKLNYDTPNPLYDTTTCTQQYYKFEDLLLQDLPGSKPQVKNPCDTTQFIADSLIFVHKRPVIDYKHGFQTRTGTFSGDSATVINTNDSLSPVQGQMFGGYSSIGGVWYNDDRFPFEWQNTYFHTDYVGQWIRNIVVNSLDQATEVKQFWDNNGNVVAMKLNPNNGCITYVAYPDKIKELCYTGVVNNPPEVIIQSDSTYGYGPLTINFSGLMSIDPENLPLQYYWEFGDGDTSTMAAPSHVYNDTTTTDPVVMYAKLTVTDDIGQTDTDSILISLNNTPPVVDITSISDGDLYSMNGSTNLPLDALVSDVEHTSGELSYSWQTFLHHNSHQHIESTDTNKVSSTVISPIGCLQFAQYYFRVVLTVTDAAGLSSVDSVRVYPACDPPSANFMSDTFTICKYDSIQFTDLSTNFAIQWEWHFPGGTPSISNEKNPVVHYDNSSGKFDVMLISSSFRGSDTLFIEDYVNVSSLPQVSISSTGNASIVCAGSKLTLTAGSPNPITSYQWSRYGVDIPGATGSTYNSFKTGNYRVYVSKANGCSKLSNKFRVDKKKLPTSVITSLDPLAFCQGDSVTLAAVNYPGYTFQWKKYSSSIPGATSQFYEVYTPGKYKIIATDSVGCSRSSNKLNVTLISCSKTGLLSNSDGSFFDNIKIEPNPSSIESTVFFNKQDAEPVQLEMHNLQGTRVFTQSISSDLTGSLEIRIDISQFDVGVYIVSLKSYTGIHHARLVIAR